MRTELRLRTPHENLLRDPDSLPKPLKEIRVTNDERTSTAGLHLLRHMLRTILAIALASSVCAKTHSGTKR